MSSLLVTDISGAIMQQQTRPNERSGHCTCAPQNVSVSGCSAGFHFAAAQHFTDECEKIVRKNSNRNRLTVMLMRNWQCSAHKDILIYIMSFKIAYIVRIVYVLSFL